MIAEGEWLSLNGSTGEVILGKQPLSPPALSGDLETFMSWADQIRHLKVIYIPKMLTHKFASHISYIVPYVRTILKIREVIYYFR